MYDIKQNIAAVKLVSAWYIHLCCTQNRMSYISAIFQSGRPTGTDGVRWFTLQIVYKFHRSYQICIQWSSFGSLLCYNLHLRSEAMVPFERMDCVLTLFDSYWILFMICIQLMYSSDLEHYKIDMSPSFSGVFSCCSLVWFLKGWTLLTSNSTLEGSGDKCRAQYYLKWETVPNLKPGTYIFEVTLVRKVSERTWIIRLCHFPGKETVTNILDRLLPFQLQEV